MKTQTALGWLFFLIGLVLFGVDLAPTVLAIGRSAPHVDPPLLLLGVSICTMLFGAWLLPSSNVGRTVHEFRTELAETTLPIIGRRSSAAAAPSEPPPKDAA